MAYEIRLDMGITERAIISAVQELQDKKTQFSYNDIANVIPCSVPTVKRHMPKMLESGKIKRIGETHARCRYEVVENA
jgi:DNA-binding Lrp family transcriptional regulator